MYQLPDAWQGPLEEEEGPLSLRGPGILIWPAVVATGPYMSADCKFVGQSLRVPVIASARRALAAAASQLCPVCRPSDGMACRPIDPSRPVVRPYSLPTPDC